MYDPVAGELGHRVEQDSPASEVRRNALSGHALSEHTLSGLTLREEAIHYRGCCHPGGPVRPTLGTT